MSRGDDTRDARVERELKNNTPHCRRRALHGVHQARRSLVEQKTEEKKSKIDGVQVDRVQRLTSLHEISNQVGSANEDDQPVEYRGMF